MGPVRAVSALGAALGLAAVLAVAGCAPPTDAAAGPSQRAEEVATPEKARAAVTSETEPATVAVDVDSADGDTGDPTLGYGEAYDLLYAAIEPSDALVDEWNAASDAEDWALVRSTSDRLADCLQTLQVKLLASAWPADAQPAAQDFAMALDQEIGWYSYVAIAPDDAATLEALEQPWTDAGVTASDELWTILEAGLAGDG